MNMLIFASVVVICMLGFSIYISRANWPYHPGGVRGYVTDMLIYFFLPVVPMIVGLGGYNIVRMFVPVIESDNVRYALMAVAIVGLFGVRRLPFVLVAQKRVITARNARYQAAGPQ